MATSRKSGSDMLRALNNKADSIALRPPNISPERLLRVLERIRESLEEEYATYFEGMGLQAELGSVAGVEQNRQAADKSARAIIAVEKRIAQVQSEIDSQLESDTVVTD